MNDTKWPEKMILVVPERSADPEWHCKAHPGPLAGTSCRYVRVDVAMSAALERIAMAGFVIVPKAPTKQMRLRMIDCEDGARNTTDAFVYIVDAAPKFDPELM